MMRMGPRTGRRSILTAPLDSVPTEFNCQGARSSAPASWRRRILTAAHRRRPAFCRGEAAFLKIGERIAGAQGKRSALIAAEPSAADKFYYDHQTHHLDSRGSLRSSHPHRCLVRIFPTESRTADFGAGYNPSGQRTEQSCIFYIRK